MVIFSARPLINKFKQAENRHFVSSISKTRYELNLDSSTKHVSSYPSHANLLVVCWSNPHDMSTIDLNTFQSKPFLPIAFKHTSVNGNQS